MLINLCLILAIIERFYLLMETHFLIRSYEFLPDWQGKQETLCNLVFHICIYYSTTWVADGNASMKFQNSKSRPIMKFKTKRHHFKHSSISNAVILHWINLFFTLIISHSLHIDWCDTGLKKEKCFTHSLTRLLLDQNSMVISSSTEKTFNLDSFSSRHVNGVKRVW